jgi:3-deoxy-manno-octulosonate cytidylyltransferase (CMP-KDO synthetase)
MSTLAAKMTDREQIADPNIVKVITDIQGRALYFSRYPIPYDRDNMGIGWTGTYLRLIGMYAFYKDFLLTFTSLAQSPLEKAEKLEQLRALENGYSILVGRVEGVADGIDTPQQYAAFVKRTKQRK